MSDSCCLTAEEVENFVFHRLSEDRLKAVEEHLLVCSSCLDRVEEEEEYVAAAKDAARQTPAGSAPHSAFSGRGVWAAALAALLIVAVWIPLRHWRPQPEEQAVMLSALRGAPAQSKVASVDRLLALHLDTAGLTKLPAYRAELVAADGAAILQATLSANGSLTWRLGRALPSGNYWVRLNDPSGAPLREYPLAVRN